VIEQFINTTGTVFPSSESLLSSQISGYYFLSTNPRTNKKYVLGDRVKKGEVIIRIVDEEYQNDLRERSKAIDNELSKMEYEKQKVLYEKGGATLRELKDAEINVINAEYDSINIKIQLEKMLVVAPFDGKIVELPYFTQGVKVTNNQEMVKFMNYDKLYLETSLPEKYFYQVKQDMDVYISNYSMPNDTLFGKVTQVSPSIDPDNRTFKCFVTIANENEKLLPGMFVKADLVSERNPEALIIPKDIISGRGSERNVFVVDNNYAYQKRITTGLESIDKVEVVKGLKQGDRVVISGFETLRNKSKVKVLE
jgi:RND family efflux transporter MFP subunit